MFLIEGDNNIMGMIGYKLIYLSGVSVDENITLEQGKTYFLSEGRKFKFNKNIIDLIPTIQDNNTICTIAKIETSIRYEKISETSEIYSSNKLKVLKILVKEDITDEIYKALEESVNLLCNKVKHEIITPEVLTHIKNQTIELFKPLLEKRVLIVSNVKNYDEIYNNIDVVQNPTQPNKIDVYFLNDKGYNLEMDIII
jgi:hypothetical protein